LFGGRIANNWLRWRCRRARIGDDGLLLAARSLRSRLAQIWPRNDLWIGRWNRLARATHRFRGRWANHHWWRYGTWAFCSLRLGWQINQWFRQQIGHCGNSSLRLGGQGQYIRCKRHSIINNRRSQERAIRAHHAPPHNGSS
jgi:hypothetical protein